jgi:hypothetical protein
VSAMDKMSKILSFILYRLVEKLVSYLNVCC